MQDFIIKGSEFVYKGFLYDIFFSMSFVSVFFFFLWRGRFYGVSRLKSVLLVLIVYPAIVAWMFIQFWLETGSFGGNNIVRCVVYMPLVAYPAAKILKLTWKQACDLLSPAACVVQSVSHWGCIFAGCCNGIPASWGLYNIRLDQNCFPSQPLEALTCLLIVITLVRRQNKLNCRVDGLSMPIMLMLFGFSRFFWEFFRDNEKLWLGCSALSFHALFMGIVGVVMYILVKKHNEKQAAAEVAET